MLIPRLWVQSCPAAPVLLLLLSQLSVCCWRHRQVQLSCVACIWWLMAGRSRARPATWPGTPLVPAAQPTFSAACHIATLICLLSVSCLLPVACCLLLCCRVAVLLCCRTRPLPPAWQTGWQGWCSGRPSSRVPSACVQQSQQQQCCRRPCGQQAALTVRSRCLCWGCRAGLHCCCQGLGPRGSSLRAACRV